ncbi:MAG: 4Fe-4S ferredoxin [Endomicrobia bacterium]|nr:4Fe-4S ferredoxin [Endomicrobiia bacterium]
MLRINNKKCNFCEECVFVCVNNAIIFVNSNLIIDINKCKKCNACKKVCLSKAIEENFSKVDKTNG